MDKLIADVKIGTNRRRLRKENGFTQEQLVAQLGVRNYSTTRSLYSRYETGELNIPVSLLITLQTIYKCNFDAFFENLMPDHDIN